MSRPKTPRLIDLHVDWLLQYAPETTLFDATLYGGVRARLGQVEGYLGATGAAILSCYRRAEDWARHEDPWRALGELLTRYEAEFPGRLLMGAEDLERWRRDPEGLTWGVLGVEGFDALVRSTADLDRLPALFERGVRLFQPAYTADGLLAGSATPGDDRGLTDLGGAFLATLAGLAAGEGGPRPIVDLAHLNPAALADVLAWFEEDADRVRHLIPVYSHGMLRDAAHESPRALTTESLRRLRGLGGYLGLTPAFHDDADSFAAAIEAAAGVPFLGRAGFEGIAIGTDFLGIDRNPSGLGTAPEVVAWLAHRFPPDVARALIRDNGERLLERVVGAAGQG